MLRSNRLLWHRRLLLHHQLLLLLLVRRIALLLWRRTAILGSLLAIVAMGQVFLLNLFYDVPVKIIAGELLLIAIALTVPYAPNLLRAALNRPAPTPVPPLAGPRMTMGTLICPPDM